MVEAERKNFFAPRHTCTRLITESGKNMVGQRFRVVRGAADTASDTVEKHIDIAYFRRYYRKVACHSLLDSLWRAFRNRSHQHKV